MVPPVGGIIPTAGHGARVLCVPESANAFRNGGCDLAVGVPDLDG